ncbi:MAG TPA: STAS domain-containing protein [bacterium]|jgi:anti-anti-sigma factor|nr:STAS domain-containing protein [bacterium]
MSEAGTFTLRFDRTLPVMEIMGEVDIANAQEFETALDRAVNSGPALVVSLEDTSYFDSKGIHVLLLFAGRLARSGQHLALVAKDGSAPRRLLEIAGVPGVVPTYGSIDEAMTAIAGVANGQISLPQSG